MKSRKDIEKEYSPLEWSKFFDGRESLSKQALKKGYNYSTAVRYFSLVPDFVEFKNSFAPISESALSRYDDVIKWCEDADIIPLFSRDIWKGLVYWDSSNKKTVSYSYLVKCPICGKEFKTCFKSSVPHLSKCPQCGYSGIGMSKYAKFTAFERIKVQLKELGYTPLFSEISSLKKYYPVKCDKCGTEFSTPLINNHFNNCPYCSESKNTANQLSRIERICKDYDYTFEDTWRGKLDEEGHHIQYQVKCNKCGTKFLSFITGHQMKLCPKCKPSDYRSNRERKLCTLLDVLNIEYYHNYKLSIPNTSKSIELDIYIPSKQVAFEFNGYYWHNSGDYTHSKPKNYHAEKTEEALRQGVKLYHIWESTSDELCQSIVLSKLGLATKVYARKLKLVDLTSELSTPFFNQCHVDGTVKSSRCFALVDGDKIMCALSLNQRRIQSTGKVQWEIARFASAINVNVVGGYSRLLKHALEYLKFMGASQLVTYCNRDLSPDPLNTVYTKLGFTFVKDSGPIYKYWSSTDFELDGKHFKRNSIISRQFFQKSKLLEAFAKSNLPIPSNASEFSLALQLGCMPCYNSGNFKYVMNL